MCRKWIVRLILLAAVIVLAVIGLDQRMVVRHYVVETDKVSKQVRLAVVTDYHGCGYGPDGADLVQEVSALQPDAILLVGDMFSADGDPEAELRMFRQLDSIAFTYYVTGNHEYWEHSVPQLLARVAETGVTLLDQSCVSLVVDGQRINICGIPDPYAYVDTEVALNRAVEDIDHLAFTVLMAHRPELIEKYAAMNAFDLVVSGHAHGGQVRIPGIVNGLCAPNQGWFPKYAGGRYDVDGTTLIVSRGLSTQRQMGVPRVFNRPEIVVIDLE
jgi:predicted MPP superfamily phosphohydrolase